MRISDVLTHKGRTIHRIRTVDPVREAVERLTDRNIGALLVYDPWGHYAGIFSERDLIHGLDRYGIAAADMTVAELMTQDIITCHPEDRVHQATELMTIHRIRHLPVEDKTGEIVGIVSIGDLVHFLLQDKALEVEVLRDMARGR